MPNDAVYKTIIDVLVYLLVTIGIGSIVVILVTGVIYITSGGNEEQIDKVKHWMVYALVGLVVAITGFVIVKLVGNAIV